MKTVLFLSLMVFSSVSALPSIGPKNLRIAVSIDMTGAQHTAGYQEKARLIIESLVARELKAGDTLTVYKVCSYAATVESLKLPDESKQARVKRAIDLAAAATKPCKGRGSAITRALSMMTGNQVYIMFTDGGLRDDPALKNDPKREKFQATVNQLISKDTKAIWFGGLSNQRHGQASLRDAFADLLPKDRRVITSGLSDAQGGFSQLTQLMKKARR